MPQFDTTTFISQLFWLAISFGMVVFCFARIFIPRFNAILEKRFLKIRNDSEQAEQMQAEAQALFDKSQVRLDETRKDADKMIKMTISNLESNREKHLAMMQSELQKGLKAIEKAHEDQLMTLHEQLAPIAQTCAIQILDRLTIPATDASLFHLNDEGQMHAPN